MWNHKLGYNPTYDVPHEWRCHKQFLLFIATIYSLLQDFRCAPIFHTSQLNSNFWYMQLSIVCRLSSAILQELCFNISSKLKERKYYIKAIKLITSHLKNPSLGFGICSNFEKAIHFICLKFMKMTVKLELALDICLRV